MEKQPLTTTLTSLSESISSLQEVSEDEKSEIFFQALQGAGLISLTETSEEEFSAKIFELTGQIKSHCSDSASMKNFFQKKNAMHALEKGSDPLNLMFEVYLPAYCISILMTPFLTLAFLKKSIKTVALLETEQKVSNLIAELVNIHLNVFVASFFVIFILMNGIFLYSWSNRLIAKTIKMSHLSRNQVFAIARSKPKLINFFLSLTFYLFIPLATSIGLREFIKFFFQSIRDNNLMSIQTICGLFFIFPFSLSIFAALRFLNRYFPTKLRFKGRVSVITKH